MRQIVLLLFGICFLALCESRHEVFLAPAFSADLPDCGYNASAPCFNLESFWLALDEVATIWLVPGPTPNSVFFFSLPETLKARISTFLTIRSWNAAAPATLERKNATRPFAVVPEGFNLRLEHLSIVNSKFASAIQVTGGSLTFLYVHRRSRVSGTIVLMFSQTTSFLDILLAPTIRPQKGPVFRSFRYALSASVSASLGSKFLT